ncbi:N-acyl homoserine lactonase family protein [uncultured Sphaerochaeta sp.]|uniref:N-acyl homoserine lactonase family protein n=1 Tax=uncultured Sphaerochaeta sp. TaxID=886478 RepID=UPI002A0A6395|nr:N-acyl homoserine lactonase family protein [uncultured Sphaerochaeta sp.]
MNYTITPINTGFVSTNKATYFYHNSVHKYYDVVGNVNAPVAVFLVEGNGKKILIDTGMCDSATASKYHHAGSVQPEGFAIQDQLAKMGMDCSEITDIIFTHLHWDHVYNINHFPQATLYVQKTEYEYATNPIPLYYKSYEFPELGLNPPFSGREFVLLEGNVEVFEGISVYLTPGHSVGHQNVIISTKDGEYHCCGDLIFTFDNLKECKEMHYDITPPGRFADINGLWASIRDMKARVSQEFILPTHDPLILEYIEQHRVLGA